MKMRKIRTGLYEYKDRKISYFTTDENPYCKGLWRVWDKFGKPWLMHYATPAAARRGIDVVTGF